ncbi:MAG: FtsX-like permease family protein, partial [Candidatus Heimdallarchaeota archaeon]|nr:FtsX-like permease family protein [Candidatus Heimdallarchaeota archaeon]
NRKRTFQAIFALSLALVIYLATTLLVSGYSSNISGMASIVKRSNLLLVVEEGETLSGSRIDLEVLQFLEEFSTTTPNIEVVLPQIYIPISIENNLGDTRNTYLRIIDFERFELLKHHQYTYNLEFPEEGEVIVGQHLSSLMFTGVGDLLLIKNNTDNSLILNETIEISNIIESGQEYDIEVLSSFEFIESFLTIEYYSFVELKIIDTREIDSIKKEIKDHYPHLDVFEEKQTQNFIIYATNEVIQTLTLLVIMFFGLMLVSITYTIYSLVKESEDTIFILRSIGATKQGIVTLFMFQALLIGIISALLSLLIGYLGVSAIVAIISASTGLPFIALQIDIQLVGIVFFFSLFLSVISGIYPSLKAAQIKVIKEEI